MTETMHMWLKLLIDVLPLIPTLIGDVETAITELKSDPDAQKKAAAAQAAVNDVGAVIKKVIESLT